MAHLNLYLPDDLADSLKRDARSTGQPLSRYVSGLLSSREVRGGWSPAWFDRACGFLSEEIAEPADSFPEPMEDL